MTSALVRRLQPGAGDFRPANLSGSVLMIEHGWGGGIERAVGELALFLREGGIPTWRMRPMPDQPDVAVLIPSEPHCAVTYLDLGDADAAVRTLTRLEVSHVHIHSLVGYRPEMFPTLRRIIAVAGLAYDFTAHDYLAVCPRVSMIDRGGMFCDSPDLSYCEACIAALGSPFGRPSVAVWRATYRAMLADARRLFAPSAGLRDDLGRRLGGIGPVELRPHPQRHKPTWRRQSCAAIVRRRHGVRVIGMIGAIGIHKGARVLLAIAADAIARNLPISYRIYGYIDDGPLSEAAPPNVEVTGRYQEGELDRLLAEQPCDAALFASVCPETFCYALDHAFEMGILPVSFDLGAPADRIRATGRGVVLPRGFMRRPGAVNDALLNLPMAPSARNNVEPGRRWLSGQAFYDG